MRLSSRIWARVKGLRNAPPHLPEVRPPQTHVVLLDGTMSSLTPGHETNIGLTYKMLLGLPDEVNQTLYYEPGIQWRGLLRSPEVIAGIGINRQIKRAYLFLARNYHPGDKIVLMGFSRGAYAVRSLAGLIDKMGLLRKAQITEETLERVYHLYRCRPDCPEAKALRNSLCHQHATIAYLGVYDTVRALGMRWPVLWRILPNAHAFHNDQLGPSTDVARQALALHENRDAFAPVLWDTTHDQAATGCVQQLWFRGTHGDIGGQIHGREDVRPLANIPLRWILHEAEACGLTLPEGWRDALPTDITAPSIGAWRGWGKILWVRHRRKVGRDPSERLHATATVSAANRGLNVPVLPTPDVAAVSPAE
ncbi:MAG: DUF2235 domain-containing protein [Pseudomonadota bacterium]